MANTATRVGALASDPCLKRAREGRIREHNIHQLQGPEHRGLVEELCPNIRGIGLPGTLAS